jgi:phosphoribosylanthranilate isomerase
VPQPTDAMPLMHFRDFIQIAGVRDMNEAQRLMDCGVHFLGFPLRLPVHQEDLSEADAAAIIRAIRPPCYGVAITYQDAADDIAAFMDALGSSFVQLHGDIDTRQLERLRRLRPDLVVIKSLVVGLRDERDLADGIERLSGFVDAFITDTFDPTTGASGATGRTHDWAISRRLVALSPKPVILAGGLNAENVGQAIRFVRPAGVDAHTGVEDAEGRKNPAKVRKFVAEARAGFEWLRAGVG